MGDIANAPILNVERERSFNEVDSSGNEITRYKKEKKTYYSNSIEPKKVYELPKNDDSGKVKIIYQDNIDLTGIKPEKVRRFIDINIVTDTFTLTIENKIDTGEHSLQCVAYRNFMLNSSAYNDKGQDHYFVLLAKDKPDDFDKGTNETTGRYPGYVYMDYNMIRKILVEDDKVKNSFSSESGQDKAVAQYAQMIDEWTNLPDELVEICKKIRNFEPFAEKAQYDELMKSEELTEAEKRFADVARRYYLRFKEGEDEKIKSALKAISQVPIKDDYGRGKYAPAINLPDWDEEKYARGLCLLLDDDLKLTEEEYKQYKSLKRKKKLKDNDKAFRDSIQEVIKNAKKRYKVMNSVDYRAPMAGYNNPNIAFICGLTKDLSEALCNRLVSNKDSLKKLDDMKKSGKWEIAFTYYFGDGSNMTSDDHLYRCYAVLPTPDDPDYEKKLELLKESCEESCEESYFSPKYADDVLDINYLDYLYRLKKEGLITDYEKEHRNSYLDTMEKSGTLFSVEGFVNELLPSYLLRDKKGMTDSLEAIDTILETKMYQKDFESFKTAHPIFDDGKCHDIKEKLNEMGYENVDIQAMQAAVKIALFNKWIQSEENAPCCTEVKGIIEALKKAKSLAELTNENAKTLAERFFNEEHKSGSKSSLYKDLKAKTNQVNAKCVRFGWQLVMVYCLNDDEIDKIDKTDDTDDTKKPMPKLKQALRSHTLEGAKVFGYDKWFETVVFKPEESETEDSN